MAFLASDDYKYTNQLLQGTPIESLLFTAREFRSAVQNKFGVPQSRRLPIVGRLTTNHAKNTPLLVGSTATFLKPRRAQSGAWGTPRPAKTFSQSRLIG